MSVSKHPLPDLANLTDGLTKVLCSYGLTDGPIDVVDRHSDRRTSTYPSEIVTCRLKNGDLRRLFCKYGSGTTHRAHGHRGGVAYEADVYRHILARAEVSTALFYGSHQAPTRAETWLILDYLDDSRDLSLSISREDLGLTAEWLGRFHAANGQFAASGALRFLNEYDTDYFIGWARRTCEFADSADARFPWLASLCARFEGFASLLLSSPPTVVHGEFYPKNILLRDGVVYPVDWESAALAAGEIDLASLTDMWSEETEKTCLERYEHVRWPEGSPADFKRRFAAASLYLQFRWLGDRPDWTNHPKLLPRFEQLKRRARQLGLLDGDSAP
jgi:hypothetical protein